MSQHRNYRSGFYPQNSHPHHNRMRRQNGGGSNGGYNGHPRNYNPMRCRHELPPLIPIPQHRRTCSTNSSLSSCSSGGSYSSSSTLSSRFSSFDEQQKYIDSFEATLASDNPFNQTSGNPFEEDQYVETMAAASIPPPFYHYPPPPSKMLKLIREIRKYDVEKLKTVQTISLDELYDEEGEEKSNEDKWLSQMTLDVFRLQSQQHGDDYSMEEPFSVTSSSSSSNEEDVDNFEFNHHIHSLLDLISS
ncbi:uncharacterized protein [Lepeophtheirus salmonis]|uniref:uncharacterized protein n=1 Tax=Lepeophtheirus salmonis TaxID=72036 RepID=UPI001AE60D67|nr:uncharacterized protein LOC121117857 [Lepeophtheirus salmonis]